MDALEGHRGQVHTLTMDNGNEFAQHEKMSKMLQADVYLSHPWANKRDGGHRPMAVVSVAYIVGQTVVDTKFIPTQLLRYVG